MVRILVLALLVACQASDGAVVSAHRSIDVTPVHFEGKLLVEWAEGDAGHFQLERSWLSGPSGGWFRSSCRPSLLWQGMVPSSEKVLGQDPEAWTEHVLLVLRDPPDLRIADGLDHDDDLTAGQVIGRATEEWTESELEDLYARESLVALDVLFDHLFDVAILEGEGATDLVRDGERFGIDLQRSLVLDDRTPPDAVGRPVVSVGPWGSIDGTVDLALHGWGRVEDDAVHFSGIVEWELDLVLGIHPLGYPDRLPLRTRALGVVTTHRLVIDR